MRYIHKLFIALIVSLLILSLKILKIPFIESVDSAFYQLKFKLRGSQPVDTSIVFLYIDDDAIRSLGGYPLKRSYYALLIDMLTKLNVKAIALDILLTEKNLDYPERDKLLAFTIKNSGKVYLGGNFENLGDLKVKPIANIPTEFLFKPKDKNLKFPYGSNFSAPFDELLKSCTGFGHLNYNMNGFPNEIPMLISINDSSLIPSFSLELACAYLGIPRDSMKIFNDKITLDKIKIPLKDGKMLINYAGGTKSLQIYSAVDFVKSYDSLKNTDKFKDKIVFIGIYSEALRQTIKTPFDEKFPPTGIHIMALNTVVKQKFLSETGHAIDFIFSFLLSFLILNIVRWKTWSIVRFLTLSLLVILFSFSLIIILFAFGISISAHPIISAFVVTFIGAFSILEMERKRSTEIEAEKRKIEEMLKAKELKIIELQNEIEILKIMESKLKLEKVYDEVKELTSKFEDLSEFGLSEKGEGANFEGIVYAKGSKMERIISIIKKVAPSDVPILITGENGVGKELVAIAIHKLSERRDKKFIAINCSAIPETLLESELFGYEKGAFTGAMRRKNGLFELANGGTIFLDEIAETSEAFQTKILRILQSGEFNRIGGTEILKVDVRIIAATNRDIEKAVRDGKFREDLYYRLNVVRIHIPPLRERGEDIPFLVEHFLKKFKANNIKVSQAVMSALLNYEWPGNIRQLENAIKRAIIFAKSDGRNLIQLKDLPEEIAKSIRGKIDIEEKILNLFREKKFSHSSVSEIASELGLNRGTVSEYLRGICFRSLYECKFDIDKASSKIAENDNESTERVKRKMNEYIQNFIDNIRHCKSENEVRTFIKSKYKNLPARYHFYLEELAIKFLRGELKLWT